MINCAVTVMPVLDERIGFLRRELEDTFAGLLVAPGGKVEESDGVLLDGVPYYSVELAAVRELFEETGLVVSRQELKYFCSLTLPHSGRIVISLYFKMVGGISSSLLFLRRAEIEARDDFAPGMKTEALLLLGKLYG